MESSREKKKERGRKGKEESIAIFHILHNPRKFIFYITIHFSMKISFHIPGITSARDFVRSRMFPFHCRLQAAILIYLFLIIKIWLAKSIIDTGDRNCDRERFVLLLGRWHHVNREFQKPRSETRSRNVARQLFFSSLDYSRHAFTCSEDPFVKPSPATYAISPTGTASNWIPEVHIVSLASDFLDNAFQTLSVSCKSLYVKYNRHC